MKVESQYSYKTGYILSDGKMTRWRDGRQDNQMVD